MKQLTVGIYFAMALFVFVGCSNHTNEPSANDEGNNSIMESAEEDKANDLNETDRNDQDVIHEDSNDISPEENENLDSTEKMNDPLAAYSSEQIEYARIWLQLGPNQELDELNVHHIPAGEPLHPEDETSVGYPEDVIQLSGTRLVDGSITYSGNGDGTINVYNVPLRWDGVYPAGEEFYQDIIDNTELVSINIGEDEEVIAFIKLLNH